MNIKILNDTSITKLIQLIKSSFLAKEDTAAVTAVSFLELTNSEVTTIWDSIFK